MSSYRQCYPFLSLPNGTTANSAPPALPAAPRSTPASAISFVSLPSTAPVLQLPLTSTRHRTTNPSLLPVSYRLALDFAKSSICLAPTAMDFCLKDEWKALNVSGQVSASVKTIPLASTNNYLRNSAPSLLHVSTIVSVVKHDCLVHAFYVLFNLPGSNLENVFRDSPATYPQRVNVQPRRLLLRPTNPGHVSTIDIIPSQHQHARTASGDSVSGKTSVAVCAAGIKFYQVFNVPGSNTPRNLHAARMCAVTAQYATIPTTRQRTTLRSGDDYYVQPNCIKSIMEEIEKLDQVHDGLGGRGKRTPQAKLPYPTAQCHSDGANNIFTSTRFQVK
ncbi:hypothetical protein C8J57DRAFT_1472058 [Mycena rebaudengoi]|nr:hypothetical protein C8J57DRAFT_1472058 [Mycena rebaudengoi]